MNYSLDMDLKELIPSIFVDVFEIANLIKKCTEYGFKAFIERSDSHFVCFQKTKSEMQPSYQWMLSPEVLKKTNNVAFVLFVIMEQVQDSSRSNLSEQLPFNYAQTNQYINPAVGISYQNLVISVIYMHYYVDYFKYKRRISYSS